MSTALADWRVRIGLGVAIAATLAVVLWLVFLRGPGATGQAPSTPTPPHIPILVSAGTPQEPHVPVGGSLTVAGHAIGGSDLAALELWAGDERVAVRTASTARRALHATWSWTPEVAGPAALFVRAINADGSVAQSNVLQVAVDPAGEAPAAQAPPRAVLAVAPGPPELALTPAGVQLTVDGCTATVEVDGADDESGLALYQLGPSSVAFQPVGTLAASTAAAFTQPLSAGLQIFAVSSFTDTAQVFGDPIVVQAPDGCGGDGWSGPVQLHDGELQLPQAVDRAYFYLTRDEQAAVRVPGDPLTFIEPVGGEYLAGPYLPSLDAETMTIEAWGWHAGELVSLGTGTWTKPEPGGAASPPGSSMAVGGGVGAVLGASLYAVELSPAGPASADICLGDLCYLQNLVLESEINRPAPGVYSAINRSFRWSTSLPGVTGVAWQVFLHKPSSVADLDPPFILDQGPVPMDDPEGGDFELNLMPYVTGLSVPNVSQETTAVEKLAPILTFVVPGGGGGGSSSGPTTEGPINLVPNPPTGGGSSEGFTLAQPTYLLPNELWVRVVPIQGSTPMPPSNPVHLTIVEPETIVIDTSVADYTDRWSLAFQATPPVAPDPDYARCAVIDQVTGDYDKFNPGNLIWNLYIQAGYVCYSPPDDDGWSPFDLLEAFVEFVGDAWDFVGTAWEDIKGFVVNGVLAVVPCDEFASEDTCQKIAATALDAALVAVGIPPSLPDFDAAVGALKGDLTEAMIELAGLEDACAAADLANEADSSLPTCQDVVDAALEEMVAQVEAQQSKAAGAAAGVSPPKGIILKPHPAGLWTPPTLTITATRLSAEPVPVECRAWGSIKSDLTNHDWLELVKSGNGYTWEWAHGDVSGYPLTSEGFTLPDLPVGHSISQKVWLTEINKWWETDDARRYEVWEQGGNPLFVYFDTPNHAWRLLKAGAQLTYSANSNCALGVQAVQVLDQGAGW